MNEELDRAIRQRLVAELRERINVMMSSTLLLAPLIQHQGDKQGLHSMNSLNRSLYTLLRTAQHLELLDELNGLTERAILDLGDLMTDLCRQIDGLTPDLGCTFRWVGEDAAMEILGESYLLSVAILNVVTNAVQAARTRKDGKGLIKFQWKKQKKTCHITISDNGPGLEGYAPWQGVGIGLQVARRCLEAHGGTLMLNSAPTGVTAVITLPLTTFEEEEEKLLLTDRTSGFSPLLTEFAPYLSTNFFTRKDLYE